MFIVRFFQNKGTIEGGVIRRPKHDCGPYQAVEVQDRILSLEEDAANEIATYARGKWTVNGVEGMKFDYFTVIACCPKTTSPKREPRNSGEPACP
jgi:hypothetical protein